MRRVVVMLVTVLAAGAFVLAALYQQARVNRLVAEAALLREQVQQQVALREEHNTGESDRGHYTQPTSVESARAEEHRELLRLRGQVAALRAQLAEARASLDQAKQQVPPKETLAKLEADLNDAQRKRLADFMVGLKTGNSVSDLPRLKDGVERWEELYPVSRFPEEIRPVLVIMKERVKERIAELEGKANRDDE